jgi:hypothetical protein
MNNKTIPVLTTFGPKTLIAVGNAFRIAVPTDPSGTITLLDRRGMEIAIIEGESQVADIVREMVEMNEWEVATSWESRTEGPLVLFRRIS